MHDSKEIRKAGRDIFTVNFADYLPDVLKNDPKMKAFADAVTNQMLEVSHHIDDVLIYSRIDNLPEDLIDILAFDMHIDWYDYSFPIEVKRNILKNSVKVHKKMGTKYAVETVLKSIHKGAKVEEWFNYGGKPYFFQVTIDIGSMGLSEENVHGITNELQLYKNIRSHCEKIKYNLCSENAKVKVGAFSGCGEKLKIKAFLANNVKATPKENIKAYQRSKQIITIKQERDNYGKKI